MSEGLITIVQQTREYMITKIIQDPNLKLTEGIITGLIEKNDEFTLSKIIEFHKSKLEDLLKLQAFVNSIEFENNKVSEIIAEIILTLGLNLPESAIRIPSIRKSMLENFLRKNIKNFKRILFGNFGKIFYLKYFLIKN